MTVTRQRYPTPPSRIRNPADAQPQVTGQEYDADMAGINEQVLENLKRMGVPMAYGDKVELGGSSIIPVALATFGFGSGEGEGEFGKPTVRIASDGDDGAAGDDHRGGTGAGMGGGGVSVPIGAYISDEFGTRFQPNIIALLVAALPLAIVGGWALPRLVKALKK